LAIFIPSATWKNATGYYSEARKYPSLLSNRILHFVELYINYTAEVFEMKKLLAIFTLVLVNGCNFYAEQAIRGEKIIKSNNPSVKFNMSISQGVKIKK
jgi:phosphopantetheinyl transferase